jgi:hypothetical protein
LIAAAPFKRPRRAQVTVVFPEAEAGEEIIIRGIECEVISIYYNKVASHHKYRKIDRMKKFADLIF